MCMKFLFPRNLPSKLKQQKSQSQKIKTRMINVHAKLEEGGAGKI